MSTYAPRSIGRVVGLLLLSLPATPVRAATPIITGYQLTTGVAVSSGPPGTQLVIKGANLGSSGVVKFNGSTLSYNTWSSTYSLLDLARVEAPDYVINLHSHGGLPETLETAFMPNYLKVVQGQFAAQMQQRYQAAGLPTGTPPPIQTDGVSFPGPSFNLTSALHHVSGGVSMLFEGPHGLLEPEFTQVTHDQILDLWLMLFDELFAFAVQNPHPGSG